MPFKTYLWCMSIAALFAWVGWVYVLVSINPIESGFVGHLLFYITLLLALTGTLAVVGLLFRLRAKKDQMLFREVRIAWRHAILLSIACIASLLLASRDLLTWWNFLALFVGVGFVEYLFLIVQESKRS
ncbi:MAG: hypothetical protein Q7R83_04675 [bacterium]|nr:hypothetical protein [bacterium]